MKKLIFSIEDDRVYATRVLRYLDEDALGQWIWRRLDRRRAAGYDIALPDRDYDHKKDAGWPWGLAGAVGAGWFAGWLFHPIVGVVIGSLIGTVALADAVLNREGGHRQTATDRTALLRATVEVRLPRTSDLSAGVPGTDDRLKALYASAGDYSLRYATGVRALERMEFGTGRVLALIAVADEIVTRIVSSKSWFSQYLFTHRAQLRPADELGQIVDHALQLRKAINKLGPGPTGDRAAAVMANRAYSIARQPLDLVWDKLLSRVAALDDYKQNLILLDAELKNAQIAEHALGLNDDFQELFASAVGDEMATEHLRSLSAEAEGLTRAVAEIVAALNGNLLSLLELAPPEK